MLDLLLTMDINAIYANAWNPDNAFTNIRRFIGGILFIIVAVRATKLYNEGREGKAVITGVIGALIGLFVFSQEVLERVMGWFGTLLGF